MTTTSDGNTDDEEGDGEDNKNDNLSVVMSKGLETPVGTWVRVLRVWVEVRIFGPLPNPYPQCGWRVTHTVLQWVESQNK